MLGEGGCSRAKVGAQQKVSTEAQPWDRLEGPVRWQQVNRDMCRGQKEDVISLGRSSAPLPGTVFLCNFSIIKNEH
jgi:hypothetical protein